MRPVDVNFRLAMAFESSIDEEKKDLIDGRFVKLFARINARRNGLVFRKEIRVHRCTDDDYDKFFETADASKHLYDSLRADPARGMYCINWDEDHVEMRGNLNTYEHSVVEVFVLPCNHLVKHLGATHSGDEAHETCNGDLDAQKDWLDHVTVHTLYNSQEYDSEYEHDTREFSAIRSSKFDAHTPTELPVTVHLNTIDDLHESYNITTVEVGKTESSPWKKFPVHSRDKAAKYAFFNMQASLELDRVLVKRVFVSPLDLLAVYGGFEKTLHMFLGFLIVPLVDWAHKAKVMTEMFRYRPSRREQKDKDKREKGDAAAEKELDPEQELLE